MVVGGKGQVNAGEGNVPSIRGMGRNLALAQDDYIIGEAYEWAPWGWASSSRGGSSTRSRISWMGEVMIGVGYSGWRNSRCMPRPTYCSLSMEPPQVEPEMATWTGSGQNSGWPEIRASLPPRRTAVERREMVRITMRVW